MKRLGEWIDEGLRAVPVSVASGTSAGALAVWRGARWGEAALLGPATAVAVADEMKRRLGRR